MGIKIVSLLIYILFKLFSKTYKIELQGDDVYHRLKRSDEPIIYAVAHGRMWGLIYYTLGRPITMLASQSRDGRLVTGVLHKLGYQVESGSSSRGGIKGLLSLIKHIKRGREIAVTVDGPRGPAFKVKPGVVLLASKAHASILPISYSASRSFVFNKSWDKFLLPLPFSKLTITYGNPVKVTDNIDKTQVDQCCLVIEQSLRELTNRADTIPNG